MVHRILMQSERTFIVSLMILDIMACRSEQPGDKAAQTPTNVAAGGRDTPHLEAGTDLMAQSVTKASLKQGINTIFGIRIPSGMIPAAGPKRVYRFEGKQTVSQVVYLIKQQVRIKKETREGEGYLLRFAKVPDDRFKRELAIRIFKNQRGTTLDIWKERTYRETLPDPTSRVAFRGVVKRERAQPVKNSETRRMRRRMELAQTMRVMRKIEKKERLSEADLKSNLFN
jgi:hypothetical protein